MVDRLLQRQRAWFIGSCHKYIHTMPLLNLNHSRRTLMHVATTCDIFGASLGVLDSFLVRQRLKNVKLSSQGL